MLLIIHALFQHTQHLYENAEILDHLVDDIFRPSIESNEVIMGEPDFDLLLKAGYTATMDLPFALYFEQVRDAYPDCKFILTVRENSEVWFRSWDVLTRSITKPAFIGGYIFSHARKLELYMRWLFSVVNGDNAFLSAPFPLPPQNKRSAISSYESHNQLVRDSIPPSRLLEYNVRQGWEPLCDFLGIPEGDCPSARGVPFPKSNSARAVTFQGYSALSSLMLALFVIFMLFSLGFRRATGMSVLEWCGERRAGFLRFVGRSLERRRRGGRKANGIGGGDKMD